MKLFDSIAYADRNAPATPRMHQLIGAVLTASPIALTEYAKDYGFDAGAAQSYLATGSHGGDTELVGRLRKAARVGEACCATGPHLFTPETPDQANEIWSLTYAEGASDAFAVEVIAGGEQEAQKRDHHIFAYRCHSGYTSFLYVPRHGDVQIWHQTLAISPDNFALLHTMLSDLTQNAGGHEELLIVMHEWLQAAHSVWWRNQRMLSLTAQRASPAA